MSNIPTNIIASFSGAEGENLSGEGAEAQLIAFLISASLKEDYHRIDPATASWISGLIRTVGPEYAAKAALFARHRFDMRHPAHLLAGELSILINGQPWAANFYRRLPRRPDDVLAILLYIRERYNKIPSRVKRGLGAYLRSCSEATLARYAREKHFSLKLVDAVNLLHPKHSDPLGKLMRGTLPKNGQSNGEVKLRDKPVLPDLAALVAAVREVDLMA